MNENPIVVQLTEAIRPIVSVGVGSAILSVCRKLGKKPETLTQADLPALRRALLEHYAQFWASQLDAIKKALG